MSEYDTAVDLLTAAQVIDSDTQSFRSVTLRPAPRGRTSRGNEWSSADLKLLRELASTGQPLDAIAAILRRTAAAVRNKAGMHGISLRARR